MKVIDMTNSSNDLREYWKKKPEFTSDQIKDISSMINKFINIGDSRNALSIANILVTDKHAITASNDEGKIAALQDKQYGRALALLKGLDNLGELNPDNLSLIATGLGFKHEPENTIDEQFVLSQ